MKKKKVKSLFEEIVEQVNEIKRPALEFHHEDILGRLDDVEETQARIEAKLDVLKDLILDKRDSTFRKVEQVTDVLGDK